MAELVLRAGFNDHQVVSELLTDPTALPPRRARRLRRVVIDATAIVHSDVFDRAARESGTQLLVDPQTVFLTTMQSPDDPWARLPFGMAYPVSLAWLRDPANQDQLVHDVVDFQLDHGATAVIPPYIHIEDPATLAVDVQLGLLDATRRYLDDVGFNYDLMPVLSVDLRTVSLEMNAWQAGLGRLVHRAAKLADGPIALGLSSTSGPSGRSLHKSCRIWRRVASKTPLLAWHAGQIGLLAVTMGAAGYEVGMCTAERYDARGQQRNRLPANAGSGPRYTGVYVDVLGRSLSKTAVEALSKITTVQADLSCLDPGCCRHGIASMLDESRQQHAVRSRLAGIEALEAITARGWRLHHLARQAADASVAATRLRAAAGKLGISVGAYPAEYVAMERVALGLRATARSAIA